MNKALEQILIGPLEESHTKEQSPKVVFVRGAWSKEIENGSKMNLNLGLSWLVIFWEEEGVCGGWNKWRGATMGPRGRGAP